MTFVLTTYLFALGLGAYVNFLLEFFVGLLHDFQILHIDVQFFQLESHDVLKIQVYMY